VDDIDAHAVEAPCSDSNRTGIRTPSFALGKSNWDKILRSTAVYTTDIITAYANHLGGENCELIKLGALAQMAVEEVVLAHQTARSIL